MATPDTKHSIVITKQVTVRGATRQFSNRYHFEGALPADPTAWGTLADNIVAAEKLIYQASVEIVEAVGYNAGTATATNPHGDAVFTKTYTQAGTASAFASSVASPSDAAILVRYSTLARSTKNHPVYLFNYYHGCWQDSTNSDLVSSAQKALVQTYADAWVTGFSDGTGARERCGPRGAGATAATVNQYVRHHDFPL